jgi:GTP 3',8-cyclase
MFFVDHYNREVRYLRLSLTSACHMRCVYCRPALHRNPDGDLLTPIEIEQMVRHLVLHHGVQKVRLTGGDPTARTDLLEIINRLSQIDGIKDLAMTTNGLALKAHADEYASAGLGRVNVSLDSLDPEQFARMTGVDGLGLVLEGIDAAIDAGLTPIKLNTVVLKDENEEQLPELIQYASDRGVAIRFIELMPMGPLAHQWSERYITAATMRQGLDGFIQSWTRLEQGSDSATNYRVTLQDGSEATVGFITPMSCNFCAACNRIRIAGDGSLYPCLMDNPAGSILPAIRPRWSAEEFDHILAQGLAKKAPEHPAQGFVTMTVIGG